MGWDVKSFFSHCVLVAHLLDSLPLIAVRPSKAQYLARSVLYLDPAFALVHTHDPHVLRITVPRHDGHKTRG
jgi:hypothetical protein